MNKKSKFITVGLSAIVLGIFFIYQGDMGHYQTPAEYRSMVIGIILLVGGVASASIGFTSKEK